MNLSAVLEPIKNVIKFKTPAYRALEKRVDQMGAIVAESNLLNAVHHVYTGEKFLGGLGLSKDFEVVDLVELRRNSLELWRSNPIANGIFNRLETKIIGDGLHLEATPETNLLGFEADNEFIQQWSENLESHYRIVSTFPELVDERKRFDMPQLQRQAYNTAKLSGDALIIRRIDPTTFLPRIQIVDGKDIHTPFEFPMGINPKTGRTVMHGVEIEDNGTEVGYWVRTRVFNQNIRNITNRISFQFVPAFGANSGRRVANLLFGSRVRVDEFRGIPLLGHVIQMLKQIDRALDYEQLAMALDATLVMSVVTDTDAKRDIANMIGGGVMKKASAVETTKDVKQPDGTTKAVGFNQIQPGLIVDNLAPGQKIESHNTRRPNPDLMTSVMGAFNIIHASIGIPPEIGILTFNNNFSASRQAVNEFESTKRKEQGQFNAGFNIPYYKDLVFGLEFSGQISTPGLMQAMRSGDNTRVAAWLMAEFISRTELSVDMLKNIKMLKEAHEMGYLTHEAGARKFFGTSHRKVVAKLRAENIDLAEVNKPLKELENAAAGG